MDNDNETWLPGVHAAPNIQGNPEVFEIENEATDPDGHIGATMESIASWHDAIVLDLGAGTGFYIPLFHGKARHVIAVEPDNSLRLRAMARVAKMNLKKVSVMTGSAEHLLLADSSVDIVHARFAYFTGPGCERGVKELERVTRSGGTAFIIDNDQRDGTFASWLERTDYWSNRDVEAVERFWSEHGFEQKRIMSEWRFQNRSDFEAVVRIEFHPVHPELAEEILAEHQALTVDYGYSIYHRTY